MSDRKKRWVVVVALTLAFGGLYAGLRLIPEAQCRFLHYELQAVGPNGEEEMCSTAPMPFINLERKRFPIQARVTSKEEAGDGLYEITFEVLNPSGYRIMPHEIAITHTERLHLLMIDETMGSYHHLHPEPLGSSGLYRFQFEPRTENYRFFVEFVPFRTRQLAIANGSMSFSSWSDEPKKTDYPQVQLRMAGLDQPLRRNSDNRIYLEMNSAAPGKKLPLEKTMNAYAHLVGFEETLSGYAHMHPLTVDPEIGESARLEFIFHPTMPGPHRIWVQIRVDGQEVFHPFDAEVM